MLELSILLCIALIFYWVGIGITKENAPYILSGYNTLSKEKKKNFDLDGYLLVHRKFFTLLAISSALLSTIIYFIDESYFIVVVIYQLLAFIYFFWKTLKYDQNPRNWANYFAIGVVTISIMAVIWLTVQGFKNDEIAITKNKFTISGMYDKEIDLSSIDSIAIVKQLPHFPLKINGLGIGEIRKGYFKNLSGEKAFLSVTKSNLPYYLYIRTNNRELIYINSQGRSVQSIYSELQIALRNH
jgi:hypothetical protein